jgi:hypothetical protein
MVVSSNFLNLTNVSVTHSKSKVEEQIYFISTSFPRRQERGFTSSSFSSNNRVGGRGQGTKAGIGF